MLLIEIMIYLFAQIEISPAWSANIEAKCGAAKLKNAFTAKSMVEQGLIGLGFGAFYGLYFAFKFFKGSTRYLTPSSQSGLKAVARVIVTLLLCSPCLLIYFGI